MTAISPQRRSEIIDALRAGAVPRRGLEALAVGLDHFERVIGEELEAVRGWRQQVQSNPGRIRRG